MSGSELYQPLVSVIVPNYNHASWVQQRIDSVLQQTYPHVELILLDDASTDESRDILETYRQEARLSCFLINEVNSGSAFLQWQKGLRQAKGELAWIAESDDFTDPAFLATLVPAFKDPSCVLAYSEAVFVDIYGQAILPPSHKEPRWFTGKDFLEQHMMLYDSLVNAGMVLFRRSCLQQLSDSYLSYRLSGDYRFFCEIILQGNVYRSGQPQAYFRKHGTELTTRYLGTITYHEEHLGIVEWLLQQGVGHQRIFSRIARNELAGLYCVEKDWNEKDFRELVALFRNSCRKYRVLFPWQSARFDSYRRKFIHWYGKKLAGGALFK